MIDLVIYLHFWEQLTYYGLLERVNENLSELDFLSNVENNPYMADEEYRDLLMKSDPFYINQSSHLGFAKLNSYLNSIEYFVVLSRLY